TTQGDDSSDMRGSPSNVEASVVLIAETMRATGSEIPRAHRFTQSARTRAELHSRARVIPLVKNDKPSGIHTPPAAWPGPPSSRTRHTRRLRAHRHIPLGVRPGTYQAPLRPGHQSARMSTPQTSLEATTTEIIEGPIAATDRVYAFDKIRQVYPRAPSAVRRARARLAARPHPTGSRPATAECTLVLEDGLIVSAGALGCRVRDAVDELTTRLRQRLAAPDMTSARRPEVVSAETMRAHRLEAATDRPPGMRGSSRCNST